MEKNLREESCMLNLRNHPSELHSLLVVDVAVVGIEDTVEVVEEATAVIVSPTSEARALHPVQETGHALPVVM